ncbi:catechol 2,3-dioxygenase-like lactoylglutathione lyase family enzyme [Deinococcus sp. HSC-46F16]|uniref:VOC family protein n=1 Tax=Deinococcus sp. HSC-46F16 TaxID=2910968 RepID=UPI00209D4141|nr:VOC family protein [Deinococcus sp. HSC-46F16]MCP2014665.1 catechol 2,3-dioxygenase-like lactoylglutathione lyase family enzyme [Deinococcus sp. HSC-46F16]
MAVLEHVAFRARDLGRTQVFYELLGAETSLRGERLLATFRGGTRLIFDRSETAPDVAAVTYLGLELDSFDEVDRLLARISEQTSIQHDMREHYRHTTGPYGFFVTDPDGYVLKVFKYHGAEEA